MTNLFDISQQVIVISGATGVLAGAAADYLLDQGATVVYLSRSQEKADAAVSRVADRPGKAAGYACDVTDKASLQQVRTALEAEIGPVTALINGAGGNMPGATIGSDQSIFDLEISDYETVLKLNLQGTLLPSLVFGERMASRGNGSIINFSSMAAQQAITRVLGYSNAKAAVDNLTRWMAVEMAKRHGEGLRVNAVAPGFFIANQNRRLLTNEDGSLTERGQQIITNTPMGRFGEAQEVCGAIHYLLAPASKFVTGTVLAVDGGFGCYSGV